MLSGETIREGRGESGGPVRLMSTSGLRAWMCAVASFCLVGAGVGVASSEAAADTLEWALVQAYQNNPSLNAQRATLRATDENVLRLCPAIGRKSA